MEFDDFSLAVLLLRNDAPELDEEAASALQDAHLAHLARLHDGGQLIAAGPVGDPRLRGFSLFRAGVEETRELCAQDPAVLAGRLEIEVYPWIVPAGALLAGDARFPRSMADADA
jgi:uncharacterized protein YciI